MRLFIVIPFLMAAFLTLQSHAQQSDTPPTHTTSTDTLGKVIFNEIERKAIETFYDKLPVGTAGEVIKDVVNTATQTTASTTAKNEDDNNDDDDKKDVKRDKQKKGNGKNKDRSKDKSKKMPPGLAKRKSLPPGLQKQLERNGTLPPGLAKRELPSELEANLPPPAEGTERVIAGNDVVLVEQATGIILDILKDVITK